MPVPATRLVPSTGTERVDGLTNDIEALKQLIDVRMAADTRRPRVRT